MSLLNRIEDEKKADKKSPRKPAAKSAQMWVTKPLNNPQKAQLSIAARDAFKIQENHGLTDTDFDTWRREQIHIATAQQCSGLREATNKHFRSILARFYALAGKEKEAAELWQKTGRVKGSEQVGDTHENRELARAIIRDKIAASNGLINDSYVAAIVRNKHQGKTLHDLTAAELQQLVFTITARLNKKT